METKYKCSCGYEIIFSSDGKHPKWLICGNAKCKKKIYPAGDKKNDKKD